MWRDIGVICCDMCDVCNVNEMGCGIGINVMWNQSGVTDMIVICRNDEDDDDYIKV